jgi:hypothetical protein
MIGTDDGNKDRKNNEEDPNANERSCSAHLEQIAKDSRKKDKQQTRKP